MPGVLLLVEAMQEGCESADTRFCCDILSFSDSEDGEIGEYKEYGGGLGLGVSILEDIGEEAAGIFMETLPTEVDLESGDLLLAELLVTEICL